MPKTFSKMEISFQYPDNWTLDEEDAVAGGESVTVYSPGGSFWSVAVHPHYASPTQLALAALEAMKEEYEGLEIEDAQETVYGRELVGYNLNFYYLDLTNTTRIRCFATSKAAYTIFWQADDAEYDQIQMVFQAMLASLLNSVGDAA